MRRSQPFVLLVLPLLALVGCSEGGEPAANAAQQTESTAVVSFEAMNESGMMGSLMMAPGGEAVTVKVEILGVKEGERYPTELRSGTCADGGNLITELEPLTVNTLGIGSSSTQVARSQLSSGSHFVQVHLPDGTPSACADLP